MELTFKFAKENKGKRFNVKLKDGTVLKSIGFFAWGERTVCYMNSRQRRFGTVVPYFWNIESIEEVIKPEITAKGNAAKIKGRIHPNAWSGMVESLNQVIETGVETDDFRYHFRGKLNFRNVSSLLNRHDKERLKLAFENKTIFRWSRSAKGANRGRDLSIETNLCEDGIFRAWFSSEYKGCGNGDYYLLLSPTTAIYYERD